MKILHFTNGDVTKVPPDARIITKEATLLRTYTKEQRKIVQDELASYFRTMDDLWEAMLKRLETRLGMDPEAVAQLVEEEK